MSKHHPRPSHEEIRNIHFDFLHPIELPAPGEPGAETHWELLGRGSDVHIAFLEQALSDLSTTLAKLKAQRARRLKQAARLPVCATCLRPSRCRLPARRNHACRPVAAIHHSGKLPLARARADYRWQMARRVMARRT